MSLLPQIPLSGHWVVLSLARCTLSLAGRAGLRLHEEVFQGRYTEEGLGRKQERLGAEVGAPQAAAVGGGSVVPVELHSVASVSVS